jgi:hypothetical protein
LWSTPPGLRFLHGLGRHLPHPASPEGSIGEGAHPAPAVQRLQGGRAIPAAQLPKKPCSRGSSRWAGASVRLPKEWAEPDAWSGWRCSGGSATFPLPKHGGVSVFPGIVDSSCSARPSCSGSSEEGFRRSMPFTRPGSCGAGCKQPAAMSLAGLLSWCSQRSAPPSTSASCVHSQHTAVLVRTRCSPR